MTKTAESFPSITLNDTHIDVLLGSDINSFYLLSPGVLAQMAGEVGARIQFLVGRDDIHVKIDSALYRWNNELPFGQGPLSGERQQLPVTPTKRQLEESLLNIEKQLRDSGVIVPDDFAVQWEEVISSTTEKYATTVISSESIRTAEHIKILEKPRRWREEEVYELRRRATLPWQETSREHLLGISPETDLCVKKEAAHWATSDAHNKIRHLSGWHRAMYTPLERVWIMLRLNPVGEPAVSSTEIASSDLQNLCHSLLRAGAEGQRLLEELLVSPGWSTRLRNDVSPARRIVQEVIASDTRDIGTDFIRATLLHADREVRILGTQLAARLQGGAAGFMREDSQNPTEQDVDGNTAIAGDNLHLASEKMRSRSTPTV